MEHVLFGAVLGVSELAYLLALVDAKTVIGVEVPELFPVEAESRDATFKEGRSNLEANGWLTRVEHSPEEFDLNPILLEMAAIVADPEQIVATTRVEVDAGQQLLLHYLAGEATVELAASEDRRFHLGLILNSRGLPVRIARMLHLSGPAQGEGFTLRQEVFESLREMSEERESEGLERMLDAAAVNGRARAAFVRSLASPVSGQVVVVRPRNGEIGEGRRAWIFGQGGEAWVARRPQADSEVVDVQPVDDANLGALLSSWLEDLAG